MLWQNKDLNWVLRPTCFLSERHCWLRKSLNQSKKPAGNWLSRLITWNVKALNNETDFKRDWTWIFVNVRSVANKMDNVIVQNISFLYSQETTTLNSN